MVISDLTSICELPSGPLHQGIVSLSDHNVQRRQMDCGRVTYPGQLIYFDATPKVLRTTVALPDSANLAGRRRSALPKRLDDLADLHRLDGAWSSQ